MHTERYICLYLCACIHIRVSYIIIKINVYIYTVHIACIPYPSHIYIPLMCVHVNSLHTCMNLTYTCTPKPLYTLTYIYTLYICIQYTLIIKPMYT